jgi:streptogramin lyase
MAIELTGVVRYDTESGYGQAGEPWGRYRRTLPQVFGEGAHRFQVVDNWVKRPRGMSLGDVAGVAVDAADHVYLYTRSAHPVQVFDADGNFIRWWGQSDHTAPHGITVARDGNLWLADTGDHMVKKYTPEGRPLLALGNRHQNATRMSGQPFNMPTRVAEAPNGDIWVSDGYGNNHIHIFTADGDHRRTFGGLGTGPGQFDTPHSIVIDHNERVYVCDRQNDRIQIFNLDGEFQEEWLGVHEPDDLTVGSDGTVYVAELQHRISIWNQHGQRVAGWGDEGCDCGPGPLPPKQCSGEHMDAGMVIGPHGIAIDSQGAFYVGDLSDSYRGIDRGSRSIQKFVPLK